MFDSTLRIGLIGASEIAKIAILDPVRTVSGMKVSAVAARDPARASAYANEHGIANIAANYDELVNRDDVDLVYISLPNILHERWAVRAMQAGKHVLLEKPAAPNPAAAKAIVETANATGVRVIEAFHYRYHPVFARVLSLVQNGEIGQLRTIESNIDVPLPMALGANRWSPTLGGGALMELGCYAVHWTRALAGEIDIIDAKMRIASSGVDDQTTVRFSIADSGVKGGIVCSMEPHNRGRLTTLTITGELGEIYVRNPVAPQMGYEFRWQQDGNWRDEVIDAPPSYACQLQAICDGLLHGTPLPTEGNDIAGNMNAIAAIVAASARPTR